MRCSNCFHHAIMSSPTGIIFETGLSVRLDASRLAVTKFLSGQFIEQRPAVPIALDIIQENFPNTISEVRAQRRSGNMRREEYRWETATTGGLEALDSDNECQARLRQSNLPLMPEVMLALE